VVVTIPVVVDVGANAETSAQTRATIATRSFIVRI
jgi:hypothetical protein